MTSAPHAFAMCCSVGLARSDPEGQPATPEKFFHAHHSVRKETIARRIAARKAALPLVTDPAVSAPLSSCSRPSPPRCRPPWRPSATFAQEIETRCRTHEDSPLFASLPGAGPVYAARLTAAMGTARDRWTPVEEWLVTLGELP